MSQPRYDFVAGTFHFFSAVGRRPFGALWIAVWQLVLIGAAVAAIIAVYWPVFELMAQAQSVDIEAELIAMVLSLMGWISLISLAIILLSLMAQGAWMRLLTRNEVSPGIPFRFGGDELRLLGVNLVFSAFWVLAYILTVVLVAVIVGFGAGAGDVGGTALIALAGTLGIFVAVVVLIIVCLRFAAAPALSVHQRRFRLFEAVAASKGVAGMMFLSYLALVGVWFAGYVIVSTVQTIALLFGAAEVIGQMGALHTDPEAADPAVLLAMLGETLASPAGVIILVVVILSQFIFQIAFEGLWHGVGAYVAKRHGGAQGEALADGSAPAAPMGGRPA
jgi:hypothetical protein